MKIAVLSDLHFGSSATVLSRRAEIADILLLRLVRRLNQHIQPDVVVILGDLLEFGDLPDAPERWAQLRKTLDLLKCPWIVLPGNHDVDSDLFYKTFSQPPDIVDLAGARFLPFVDKDEPGYNARRSEKDVQRFDAARHGEYKGPIIALQHVSMGPPEKMDVPYYYLNAANIIDAMRRNRVILSLSGHAHVTRHVEHEGMHFVVAPALCENPFRYLVVTLDGDNATVEEQALAMPPELELTDWHVHTQFAYCNENMDVQKSLMLAKEFGIRTIGFAEHSGQLLFSPDTYWHARCFDGGIESRLPEESRLEKYQEMMRFHCGDDSSYGVNIRCGFEADCDYHGRLLITREAKDRADFIIGSIHQMRTMKNPDAAVSEIAREHRFMLEGMLKQGITIFAHPFRGWEGMNKEIPVDQMRITADLLKRYGAAAELNYHNRPPNQQFVEMCLESGVKLSLGSDSHNLCDIGNFWPHLRFLQELGVEKELDKILLW